jgi:hypothetical protein
MALPLWAALADPDRYAEMVPVSKIFAAGAINEKKVWKIITAYWKGKTFKALVGVSHPHEDKIAVADGHHRFHAYVRIGLKEVPMAVSDDFVLYPIIARGLNQLHPAWQNKVRGKLRSLKFRCLGKEDQDWKV